MAWVTIIMMIIEALTKLPALIEAIKKWLENMRRVPNGAVAGEKLKFGRLLRKVLDDADKGVCASEPCPIQACADELAKQYT